MRGVEWMCLGCWIGRKGFLGIGSGEMNVRLKLYVALVNRVDGIRERYYRKRGMMNGIGRVRAWGYLLWLNFAYYVLRVRGLGVDRKSVV